MKPALGLENHGFKSRFYARTETPKLGPEVQAVIFLKSFTRHDLALAQTAASKRIPIVLDICDNVFIDAYSNARFREVQGLTVADAFLKMAHLASVIVTTGDHLASIIREKVGPKPRVVVIPDGLETRTELPRILQLVAREQARFPRPIFSAFQTAVLRARKIRTALKFLALWMIGRVSNESLSKKIRSIWNALNRKLRKLRSRSVPAKPSAPLASLATSDSAASAASGARKKIVWFGHHGGEHAQFGIVNLAESLPWLETLHREQPLELVVVSNSIEKFRKYIQPAPIPTRYVEWNPGNIHSVLSSCDLAILPNSKDEFSLCKSPNRAVLALSCALPVVATRTPALEPFRDCILFDDFLEGARRYLTDTELRRRHVELAQTVVQKQFTDEVVARQWAELLRGLS